MLPTPTSAPGEAVTLSPEVRAAVRHEVYAAASRLVFCLVCLLVPLCIYSIGVNPKYVRMFMEMEIPGGLPPLTRIMLGWTPWLLLGLIATGASINEFTRRDRRISFWTNVAAFISLAALLCLLAVARGAPMIKLIDAMG